MSFYDSYNAGKFNGIGPDMYMFRIFRSDGSFSSSHVVEESEAARNREALIRMGYQHISKKVD